jgi:hypothetical protein
MTKVFFAWGQLVHKIKDQRDNFFIRLVNKPIAIVSLLALAKFDENNLLNKTKDETIESRMIRLSLSKSKT